MGEMIAEVFGLTILGSFAIIFLAFSAKVVQLLFFNRRS